MTAKRHASDASRFLGIRKERVATAAVLLAIAVSLCGACVVIVDSTSEPPARQHVSFAAAH
jgi:hypothetical protein